MARPNPPKASRVSKTRPRAFKTTTLVASSGAKPGFPAVLINEGRGGMLLRRLFPRKTSAEIDSAPSSF